MINEQFVVALRAGSKVIAIGLPIAFPKYHPKLK